MEEKSYGFTLIEILITTIIIVVFSGASVAGYNYFNEQRKLDQAVKKFIENVETLKKNAIVGYKPPSAGGCGVWKGDFRIEVTRSTSLYRLGGAGTSNPVCILPLTGTDTNFYNDAMIIFSAINDNTTYSIGSFDFLAFGSGIKANVPSPDYAPLDANGGFSITLKNVVTNITKTVQVSRSGTITIQ